MESSREEVLKLLMLYKKGLESYKSRDFQKALQYFSECLKINPNDGPTLVYIGRCKEYIQSPPPPDWDGVFEMKSK
ncbi:MAG: tetratricopeptide repeat protein [Brevinematia bacterium]